MKKVLSLVLAVAMVLSLGVTAVASWSPSMLNTDPNLRINWNGNGAMTWTTTSAPTTFPFVPGDGSLTNAPLVDWPSAGTPWITGATMTTSVSAQDGINPAYDTFEAAINIATTNNNTGLLRRVELPASVLWNTFDASAATAATAAQTGLTAGAACDIMIYHLPNAPYWFAGTTNLSNFPNPIFFHDPNALRGLEPGRMTFEVDFSPANPGGLFAAGPSSFLGVYYPGTGVDGSLGSMPAWFTNYSAWLRATETAGSVNHHTLTLDFQIDRAAWETEGSPMYPTLRLALGAEAPLSQIVLEISFELQRTIFAGPGPVYRNTAANIPVTISTAWGNSISAVNSWNALPVGETLGISSISRPSGNVAVNPRAAKGTMRIEAGTGATRVVTFQVLSLVGIDNIYDPIFTIHRTRPGVDTGSWLVQLTGWRVVPGGQPPAFGYQVPSTWRIDGFSASGNLRIGMGLEQMISLSDNDSTFIPVLPSDFTWRIPNAEIPSSNDSGYATGCNWEVYADALLAGDFGEHSAATFLNTPLALRDVHFERVDLRAANEIGMSGTIDNIGFAWRGDPGWMSLQISTLENIELPGIITVEFDLYMDIIDALSRHIGRVVFTVSGENGGSDYIHIPDPNFAAAVREQLGLAPGADIPRAQVAVVTELCLFERNIACLEGIEYFTALEWLDARVNQLTELDISQNSALISLEVGHNQLTSLDPSNNATLQHISVNQNQLTEFHVSSDNNPVLEELWICDNQLTELDVSNTPTLTKLSVQNNQLTEFDVSSNPALIQLIIGYNQLEELDISHNPALRNLYVYFNQLEELDISSNLVLHTLLAGHNQLTSLDVSNNLELTQLNLWDNELTSLDVSNNFAMQWLTVAHNHMQDPYICVVGWQNNPNLVLDTSFIFWPQRPPANNDPTALITAIADAKARIQSNYTPASWARMQAALDAATAVRDNPGATQAEVNSAASALRSMIDRLVVAPPVIIPEVCKNTLREEIARAESRNQPNYTPASWARMQAALATALTVYADENATQAQVNSAANTLRSTINLLR